LKKWSTELMLLVVVFVWGANYTVGKYGLTYLTSLQFNALRFLVSAPILLGLTQLWEGSIKMERADLKRLLVVGTVGISLYQTLFMMSVHYTSATNASLLISMSPIFTGIFAVLAGQERFSVRVQAGSLIAFAGAAVVLLFGGNHQAPLYPHEWLGNLIGLIASVAFGWYPILAQPLLKKYSALRVTAWSSVVGAVSLLGASAWTFPEIVWERVTAEAWLSLGYSILLVTVYGLVAWYVGISRTGATKVMVYMYLIPLVAVWTAALVIGEQVHMQQIFGGLIIFAGLWLVKRQSQKKKEPASIPMHYR
jgi:drug/metabolite transporter (DMT)-like permease